MLRTYMKIMIGMQTQQGKHSVPTVKQSRPLYGSGIERTLPYLLSSDFVVVAKEDGVIEKVDLKNELAVIKYKDGSSGVIDLSDKQSKNSNGGFYITNKKELLFKEGQKFKKDDILAKNPNFFLGNDKENMTYTQGLLCKVAMACGDFTLEDSSIVTERLTNDLGCYVTMKKEVSLPVNTNIIKTVKKHDHVKVGDDLLVFEHSFENQEANDMLISLDDEIGTFISDLSQDRVISKYSGEIVDIKIYWNVDLETCSNSLQKLIKEYVNSIKERKKIVDANGDINTIFEPTEKIENEKIKGVEMEGVLIEYYIRHLDKSKTGDKIVFGTAIKTIISDVIPYGEEPYSELKPEENLDAIFTGLSVVSRMTTDSYCMLYTNKLIKGMKDKMREIWNS